MRTWVTTKGGMGGGGEGPSPFGPRAPPLLPPARLFDIPGGDGEVGVCMRDPGRPRLGPPPCCDDPHMDAEDGSIDAGREEGDRQLPSGEGEELRDLTVLATQLVGFKLSCSQASPAEAALGGGGGEGDTNCVRRRSSCCLSWGQDAT